VGSPKCISQEGSPRVPPMGSPTALPKRGHTRIDLQGTSPKGGHRRGFNQSCPRRGFSKGGHKAVPQGGPQRRVPHRGSPKGGPTWAVQKIVVTKAWFRNPVQTRGSPKGCPPRGYTRLVLKWGFSNCGPSSVVQQGESPTGSPKAVPLRVSKRGIPNWGPPRWVPQEG
jgi:hypothetical protein